MRIMFVPVENPLQECREYGYKIAKAMKEKEEEGVAA